MPVRFIPVKEGEPGPKVNTRFGYLYRDAANYKACKDIVVQGLFTREDIEPFLESKENFIPDDVGMEELQSELTGFPSSDDHVWHEVLEVEATDAEPTETFTAKELVARFKKAHKAGWKITEGVRRLGFEHFV